jgi:hypothetical protein
VRPVNSNVNWTATVASAAASWLTVTSGSPGSNVGSFTYSVAANPGTSRTGLITVAGGGLSAVLTVTQAAFQPSIVVGNPNPSPVAAAGQAGITASITANVSWTATVEAGATSWLSVTGGSPGTNSGTLTYAVGSNSQGARSGVITIAGGGTSATLTVSQASGVPFITLGNTNPPAVSANGQSGLTVSVSSNVSWTATVGAAFTSWLSITGGSTGTNNGTLTYSVGANSNAARTGTITFSGGGASATLNVAQATGILTPSFAVVGSCTVDKNPSPTDNSDQNKVTGCTLNASASTGPIQTYEFHWGSASSPDMFAAPQSTPVFSSGGVAPCGFSGQGAPDLYLVIRNGGASANLPMTITLTKLSPC